MSALELILLGGVLGTTGQAVRVVVGAKKISDRAIERQTSFTEEFSAVELGVSLVVGFTTGVLATLGLASAAGMASLSAGDPDVKTMLGIMAAGYAGTDFIEGFVKKYLPDKDGAARVGNDQGDSPQDDAPAHAIPPAIG